MTRIKPGVSTKKRHNKVFALAKGYRMSKHRLYKSAKEAVLHAGEYAFMGRKLRKRDSRALWIVRINAALRTFGMTYSVFINKLKIHNIEIDRKILALFAAEQPDIFKKIVDEVKK